jgi:hypothetical protein
MTFHELGQRAQVDGKGNLVLSLSLGQPSRQQDGQRRPAMVYD